MYISALLFSPLLVLTAQACSDISYDLERRAEVGGAMEWGYGPENGPLSWYTMNTTANALCGTGKHQTPIDLSEHTARIDSPRPYQLNYSILKDVTLYRTHHTVQVNVAATNTLNTLTFNGKVYNLLQFHFHVPSEHHIDEEYYPMEVHFVHKSADNALAVIGYVIDVQGASSPSLLQVLSDVDELETKDSIKIRKINLRSITRHFANHKLFRYSGSLTTPPCTEGVEWIVSTKPLPLSIPLFNRAKAVLKFNSRYIQKSSEVKHAV